MILSIMIKILKKTSLFLENPKWNFVFFFA